MKRAVYISDFRYHRPETIEEALGLLSASSDGVPLAGGTDLLIDLKQGKRSHRDVISLTHIRDLSTIGVQQERLHVGSTVTHNELIRASLIREHCHAISEAAGTIATEQIRNVATVGGNLCTAASCADTAPILIALDAEIELAGSHGRRTLALADFFLDHRRTALERGELLTKIIVPLLPRGTGAAFKKFGLRAAANITVASVAAVVRISGGHCEDARFVMGAVAPIPTVSTHAADLIRGKAIAEISEDRLLEQVGHAVADDARPIDDIRGSRAFRRDITAVLARRALTEALARARERDEEPDEADHQHNG